MPQGTSHKTHDCTPLPPLPQQRNLTVNVHKLCDLTYSIWGERGPLVNSCKVEGDTERGRVFLGYLTACLEDGKKKARKKRRVGTQIVREESIAGRPGRTQGLVDRFIASQNNQSSTNFPPKCGIRRRGALNAIIPTTQDLLPILKKVPPARTQEDIQILFRGLRPLRAFKSLSNFALTQLLGVLHLNTYDPHRIVFKQGEEGTSWFVILQGRVNVMVASGNSDSAGKSRTWTGELGSARLLIQNSNTVGTLGPGEGFGEVALATDARRAATIMTVEKCFILRVEKGDYNRMVRFMHEKDRKEKLFFLRKVPILSTLPSLIPIVNAMTLKSHPKNTHLLSQHHPITEVCFIKSGRCVVQAQLEVETSLCLPDIAGPFCVSVVLGYLGPGDYFGEMIVLPGPSQVGHNDNGCSQPDSEQGDVNHQRAKTVPRDLVSSVTVRSVTPVEIGHISAHDARSRLSGYLQLSECTLKSLDKEKLLNAYFEHMDLKRWKRYRRFVLNAFVKERFADPCMNLDRFRQRIT
ncbi:hypothetical protein SpCBS45565_g04383 [Spizellomyces sp. 'palustris']|nr:hypothetical protein SpCBS45565_g04383 [Spizellomyces sp. 'palustris']